MDFNLVDMIEHYLLPRIVCSNEIVDGNQYMCLYSGHSFEWHVVITPTFNVVSMVARTLARRPNSKSI